MVLYLTLSRRATAIASETRRAPIPPEMPRLPTRASSPSTFMAITEVSRETRSIEGHCDVARVAFAATSRTRRRRVFQRERARGGARRSPRRKRSSVRFAPDASDFRSRPYAHFGRVRRVGRDRACFERARRSRRRLGPTPGRVFRNVDFFHVVFFSRSSTPGPGETWIAVGTRGRAVTPARESAADA